MKSESKHNIKNILYEDSDTIYIDESFSKKTLEQIIGEINKEIDNQEDDEVMFTDIKY